MIYLFIQHRIVMDLFCARLWARGWGGGFRGEKSWDLCLWGW